MYDDLCCVHGHNLPLLEGLLKQAHKGIRANVLVATLSRLSVELAELVFEATLEASGVPLDPYTHEPCEEESQSTPRKVRSEYRSARMDEYGSVTGSRRWRRKQLMLGL